MMLNKISDHHLSSYKLYFKLIEGFRKYKILKKTLTENFYYEIFKSMTLTYMSYPGVRNGAE